MPVVVPYVIRAFGGTLILGTPLPATTAITTIATFRDGNVSADYQDGKTTSTFRDGDATGVNR